MTSKNKDTGDRTLETGNRYQETGIRRQVSGDRYQETGIRRASACHSERSEESELAFLGFPVSSLLDSSIRDSRKQTRSFDRYAPQDDSEDKGVNGQQ
jgi:hypothetical protein